LITAASIIGKEMPGMEAEFDAMGRAGAMARSAASLMVAAVWLQKSKVGIAVTVDVEGRKLQVVGQWVDAPLVPNAVEAACREAEAREAKPRRVRLKEATAGAEWDWPAGTEFDVLGELDDQLHVQSVEHGHLIDWVSRKSCEVVTLAV
jgi:hypothetical protein